MRLYRFAYVITPVLACFDLRTSIEFPEAISDMNALKARLL